ELRGEAAAHGGGQRQCGDQRRDLTGVDVRGEEPGEHRATDLVESSVALKSDDDAGEPAHHDDDADGAAEDCEDTDAEGDLGDQPQHLAPIVDHRLRNPADRAKVERQLVTEVVDCRERTGPQATQPGATGTDIRVNRHYEPLGGTICRYIAVRMRLAKNRRRNVTATQPGPALCQSVGECHYERLGRTVGEYFAVRIRLAEDGRRNVTTTPRFTASASPCGPAVGFSPQYEATTLAIKPKTRALIDAM